MKGFFITGTDTGVGKTIITAIVALALQERGLRTTVIKPIETGCMLSGQGLVPPDGLFLKNILNLDDDIDRITPVRYALPLAPLVAAKLENREVDLQRLRRCFAELNTYEAVVVEGIGGLMVPITEDYFVYDMIKELGLPVILVAAAGLGSINHTLLSIDFMKSHNISTAGLIINHNVSYHGIANRTTPDTISRLSPINIIATVPFIRNIDYPNLKAFTKVLNRDLLSIIYYK
ncbi:MAG: dethiobiotin synthase [Nitrospirae bacterium]|nr:dethiobiotin synthase [Nitrospirota bacterium]